MLSNLFLLAQSVQIGADRDQAEQDMHTMNLDHSWEDTGHHEGLSRPSIYIWKVEKTSFTTIESIQLP